MNAFLLSVVLLGQYGDYPHERRSTISPQVRDLINDKLRADTEWETQRREAASQQQIAYTTQAEDRTNTYIIASAVMGGLFLLGLMMRSGKK